MPFVTTYLWKNAFSILAGVKVKKRNRLACENDMRIAVSETKLESHCWLPPCSLQLFLLCPHIARSIGASRLLHDILD